VLICDHCIRRVNRAFKTIEDIRRNETLYFEKLRSWSEFTSEPGADAGGNSAKREDYQFAGKQFLKVEDEDSMTEEIENTRMDGFDVYQRVNEATAEPEEEEDFMALQDEFFILLEEALTEKDHEGNPSKWRHDKYQEDPSDTKVSRKRPRKVSHQNQKKKLKRDEPQETSKCAKQLMTIICSRCSKKFHAEADLKQHETSNSKKCLKKQQRNESQGTILSAGTHLEAPTKKTNSRCEIHT
jgi:hypothetical protein